MSPTQIRLLRFAAEDLDRARAAIGAKQIGPALEAFAAANYLLGWVVGATAASREAEAMHKRCDEVRRELEQLATPREAHPDAVAAVVEDGIRILRTRDAIESVDEGHVLERARNIAQALTSEFDVRERRGP